MQKLPNNHKGKKQSERLQTDRVLFFFSHSPAAVYDMIRKNSPYLMHVL